MPAANRATREEHRAPEGRPDDTAGLASRVITAYSASDSRCKNSCGLSVDRMRACSSNSKSSRSDTTWATVDHSRNALGATWSNGGRRYFSNKYARWVSGMCNEVHAASRRFTSGMVNPKGRGALVWRCSTSSRLDVPAAWPWKLDNHDGRPALWSTMLTSRFRYLWRSATPVGGAGSGPGGFFSPAPTTGRTGACGGRGLDASRARGRGRGRGRCSGHLAPSGSFGLCTTAGSFPSVGLAGYVNAPIVFAEVAGVQDCTAVGERSARSRARLAWRSRPSRTSAFGLRPGTPDPAPVPAAAAAAAAAAAGTVSGGGEPLSGIS